MKNRRGRRPQNKRPRRDVPSSSRQLHVESSFRKNPVSIHRAARTCNISYGITPATGFSAAGQDLRMEFSLASTITIVGGSADVVTPNPGASDFYPLFDEYRIEAIEVGFMYSNNAYAPGALASVPTLPILNVVFDPSDSATIALSTVLQYQNLQTVQLGNQRTQDGFVVRCAPVPNVDVQTQTATIGTMVPTTAPWISIDSPTVPHYGLKMVLDHSQSSLATQIGSLTFYVKYHLAFRLSH